MTATLPTEIKASSGSPVAIETAPLYPMPGLPFRDNLMQSVHFSPRVHQTWHIALKRLRQRGRFQPTAPSIAESL
jgi:hypothetical protein